MKTFNNLKLALFLVAIEKFTTPANVKLCESPSRAGGLPTIKLKEVISLKRIMWSSLLLGLWLMFAPFVLELINRAVVKVLWEDLILGFGIASFSLCRLLSRRSQEIAIADWIVTALGFLTLVNPFFLYSYYNLTVAIWNNVIIGGVVFLLAAYQDWKDSDGPPMKQAHRAHS